ncbi:hypothetical protein [Kineosporia succinea]|uniref:Uncharacterized protein n=1 Tax=Kineosporia succinea TaxID=84632 RepID=A0ABT9PA04_9ACTN|nr:hypothetical protein [Kineosporia succinea]MDP9829527.1 hypothetical protein [Kineosporia succinea]
MTTILDALLDARTPGVLVVVFGLVPGAVVRVLNVCWPAGDARRAENLGALAYLPRWRRPLYALALVVPALSDGLPRRTPPGSRARRVVARAGWVWRWAWRWIVAPLWTTVAATFFLFPFACYIAAWIQLRFHHTPWALYWAMAELLFPGESSLSALRSPAVIGCVVLAVLVRRFCPVVTWSLSATLVVTLYVWLVGYDGPLGLTAGIGASLMLVNVVVAVACVVRRAPVVRPVVGASPLEARMT